MKYILLAALGLLTFALNAQNTAIDINALVKLYKQNKVQQVEQFMIEGYQAEAGKPFKMWQQDVDRNGFILQMTESPNSEDVDTIFTYYLYNSKAGQVTRVTMEGIDLVPYVETFSYDKKGKIATHSFSCADPMEYSYTFNKKGQIATKVGKSARGLYDDEGEFTGKYVWVEVYNTTYSYDEKNRLVLEQTKYDDGQVNHTAYVYNDKNQLVTETMYFDEDLLEIGYRTAYEYNDKGLLQRQVEENFVFDETQVFEFRYKYF
jgi:hypothetical protein